MSDVLSWPSKPDENEEHCGKHDCVHFFTANSFKCAPCTRNPQGSFYSGEVKGDLN